MMIEKKKKIWCTGKKKEHSKQNHGEIMDLSSPLEFSSLCFLVKAKIITWCDIVINVYKEDI